MDGSVFSCPPLETVHLWPTSQFVSVMASHRCSVPKLSHDVFWEHWLVKIEHGTFCKGPCRKCRKGTVGSSDFGIWTEFDLWFFPQPDLSYRKPYSCLYVNEAAVLKYLYSSHTQTTFWAIVMSTIYIVLSASCPNHCLVSLNSKYSSVVVSCQSCPK